MQLQGLHQLWHQQSLHQLQLQGPALVWVRVCHQRRPVHQASTLLSVIEIKQQVQLHAACLG